MTKEVYRNFKIASIDKDMDNIYYKFINDFINLYGKEYIFYQFKDGFFQIRFKDGVEECLFAFSLIQSRLFLPTKYFKEEDVVNNLLIFQLFLEKVIHYTNDYTMYNSLDIDNESIKLEYTNENNDYGTSTDIYSRSTRSGDITIQL